MLRPLERSQVVWHLAVELAGSTGAEDRFLVALELLRAAGNDPTTLAHALALGGAQLRHPSGDAAVQKGVDVLAWTVKFLGHRRGSRPQSP
ncbi:MAG TPA: hypothetical protein VFA96_08785 [Nocardioides sp.]|nr:hypothetical protein [Nocardioides sp.]